MGERIGRAKVRRLMGWDMDSLINKRPGEEGVTQKQSLATTQPMPSQSLSNGSPWKSVPKFYCQAQRCMVLEYPHGQFGSGVPAFCPPTVSLVGEGQWEGEKPLVLCKHCSRAETLVLVTDPKPSTVWTSMKKINSILAELNSNTAGKDLFETTFSFSVPLEGSPLSLSSVIHRTSE